ncbi:hypothetical protein YC2023_034336 [Brassica napus]
MNSQNEIRPAQEQEQSQVENSSLFYRITPREPREPWVGDEHRWRRRTTHFKPPSDQFNEEFISVPKDFLKLTSVDMYDIVSKNPNSFAVRFN